MVSVPNRVTDSISSEMKSLSTETIISKTMPKCFANYMTTKSAVCPSKIENHTGRGNNKKTVNKCFFVAIG